MLKQYPVLQGILFALMYGTIRTVVDYFQEVNWPQEVKGHVFVGLFTGTLLYFWQFKKAAKVSESSE